MEEMEPEEQIELAIARLSRMGLPITSVEQSIVTIDFNLACLAELKPPRMSGGVSFVPEL
jgi:hypothetical protein